ncbi:MAG TPA: fumarylacetoacetate hydrolase family protein [Bryobacteraceae bacterium]|nr:fumarylacetoacetate hydrolase family protein [Bryobacteraceae bacterium]
MRVVLVIILFAAISAAAVSDRPETPFKLATFEVQGRPHSPRLGMVLNDRILDVNEAGDYLLKKTGRKSAVMLPDDMRLLIERYTDTIFVHPVDHPGGRELTAVYARRLYEIANYFHDKKLDSLPFAYSLDTVHIAAPIKYPYNLLNMAANYWTHAREMGVNKDVDQDRDAPFIFAKSPRSCIVDPGAPFYIPEGRDRIDWEGELAVIIGKPAFHVPKEKALDYVFGYSIMYDVSDRGGRKRKDAIFQGPDWFSGKSLDGAAPFGPFIVPKEFMTNPHDIHIMTRVNGVVKQDGNTSDMIYDVEHQIAYMSSIMTLYPGDVISSGTMGGVGTARKPPEYLKRGDVVEISIDGIGTLKTPMKAMSERPK